ncbi:hypothetical protein [Nocardia yamanashiensis]|uniref:hypothetical protein n=1 Tax=Nocardia yamanashiensis TaxID=209247 RepID=UPI00082CEABF|nr:hypothetical protein [Nocardia yamanashiensis]
MTGPSDSPDFALPARSARGKRPFSTQLRPETLARLDWIRRHDYVINDTVDAAINAYLDAAGVPSASECDPSLPKGDR